MKIFVILFVGVAVFVLFVKYIEHISVFYPDKEIIARPTDISLEYEDIFFKTKDGVLLNGWFVKPPHARAALLFFHGNAGNISHRLEKIKLFHQLGLSVFIIDYRGYGRSQGRASEQGIYQDALAAFDYVLTREDVNPQRIIAYGESLGGVVAIDLATQRKVAALIIDSSFSSAADIAKQVYPFIPSILLSVKMDSLSKVSRLKIPKLFLHSPADDIVPFAQGQKLFKAARAPKEFLETRGDHNTGFADSKEILFKGIDTFIIHQGWL